MWWKMTPLLWSDKERYVHTYAFISPSNTQSQLLVARERLKSGVQRVPFLLWDGSMAETGIRLSGINIAVNQQCLSSINIQWNNNDIRAFEHCGVSPVGESTPEHLNPNFGLNNTSKAINTITSEGWCQCFGVFTANLWSERERGSKRERERERGRSREIKICRSVISELWFLSLHPTFNGHMSCVMCIVVFPLFFSPLSLISQAQLNIVINEMFIVSWSMESSCDCVSAVKQDVASRRKPELQSTIFIKLLFPGNSLYSLSSQLTDKKIDNWGTASQTGNGEKKQVVRLLWDLFKATLAAMLLNCSFSIWNHGTAPHLWFVLAYPRIDGPFEWSVPSH